MASAMTTELENSDIEKLNKMSDLQKAILRTLIPEAPHAIQRKFDVNQSGHSSKQLAGKSSAANFTRRRAPWLNKGSLSTSVALSIAMH
ncbi:MAG: hypothetical protein ACXV6K_05730 [Halobacteriota archaeon]